MDFFDDAISNICEDWSRLPDFDGKFNSSVFIKMMLSWLGDKNGKSESELRDILAVSIYMSEEQLEYERVILYYTSKLKFDNFYSLSTAPSGDTDWAKTYLNRVGGDNGFINKKSGYLGLLPSLLFSYISDLIDCFDAYLKKFYIVDSSTSTSILTRRSIFKKALDRIKIEGIKNKINPKKINTHLLLKAGIDQGDILIFQRRAKPFLYPDLVKNFVIHRLFDDTEASRKSQDKKRNFLFEGLVFMKTVSSLCDSLIRMKKNFSLKFSDAESVFIIEFDLAERGYQVRVGKKRPDILISDFMGKTFGSNYKDSSLDMISNYNIRASGIEPDVVICRSLVAEKDSPEKTKPKICIVDAKNYEELKAKTIRDQILYNYFYRLDINGFSHSPGSILVFPDRVENIPDDVLDIKMPVVAMNIKHLSSVSDTTQRGVFDFIFDRYS